MTYALEKSQTVHKILVTSEKKSPVCFERLQMALTVSYLYSLEFLLNCNLNYTMQVPCCHSFTQNTLRHNQLASFWPYWRSIKFGLSLWQKTEWKFIEEIKKMKIFQWIQKTSLGASIA
jgi:hypothetical protein